MPVEADRAADGRRIAAVLTLPESVAEHRRRPRAAAAVVVGSERAADERRDTQAVEEVPAHTHSLRRPRLAARRPIDADAAPGEHAREDLLAIANLFPQRVGEAGTPARELARASADRFGNPELEEFAGALDRQRADAHGVEQLEDRRVGANAERQGENRHDG